jgi:hypothetical protein
MNLVSTIWVGIITVIFCLPFTPAAVPWRDEFKWESVNYAPITVIVVLAIVGIWWKVSAHKYFTGNVRNIDIEAALSGDDDAGGEPPKVGPPQPQGA